MIQIQMLLIESAASELCECGHTFSQKTKAGRQLYDTNGEIPCVKT